MEIEDPSVLLSHIEERPKKARKLYFGPDVDLAITKYIESNDQKERHKLFSEIIYDALSELVQNNIYNAVKKGKAYYSDIPYEDLKAECVVFLYDKLKGFNPAKGKAFSYFNRISLHYLLAHSQNSYAALIERADIKKIDEERNLDSEMYLTEQQEELRSFIKIWANNCNNNLEKLFKNKKEQKIANAVYNLFENIQYLDIYNKKALYIMIREQVDVKTHLITSVVNDIADHFKHNYAAFLKKKRELE